MRKRIILFYFKIYIIKYIIKLYEKIYFLVNSTEKYIIAVAMIIYKFIMNN